MCETETHYAYLPIVFQSDPPPVNFGCQVDSSLLWAGVDYAPYLVANRVYETPCRWAKIEPIKGAGYVPPPWLERNVAAYQALGCRHIICIKSAPEWAQEQIDGEYLNYRPKIEYATDYAAVVNWVIERYQPYAVELWNEPDQCPINDQSINGWQYVDGWINPLTRDAKEGGRAYGEFNKIVIDIIRATHPEVKILAPASGGWPQSVGFIAEALGVGLLPDAISYHKYLTVSSEFELAFYYAEVLRQYWGGELYLTETSIIGDGSEEHEQRKADYMYYLKNNLDRLAHIAWYAFFNNWANTAMFRGTSGTPLPAYTEFAKPVEWHF